MGKSNGVVAYTANELQNQISLLSAYYSRSTKLRKMEKHFNLKYSQ